MMLISTVIIISRRKKMQSHLRYGSVTELFDPEELGIAEGERHINQGLETVNCLVCSFCVAGV